MFYWARAVCGPVAVVILSVAVVGCAGAGPGKYLRAGMKAHDQGDYSTSLANFECALSINPAALQRTRHADKAEAYQDSQIQYGLTKAAEAEKEGKLCEAWVWYVQASYVSDDDEQCRGAAKKALEVRKHLAEQLCAEARANGDPQQAFSAAVRGNWFGADDQGSPLIDILAKPMGASLSINAAAPIMPLDVAGAVRTDSLQELKPSPLFIPYGLPVYFGDVPRYYMVLGELQIKGIPFAQNVPSEFAHLDSLWKLTKKATKQYDADALINVHYWTKSQKAFTKAQAVKFVNELNGRSTNQVKTAITDLASLNLPPLQMEQEETKAPRHGAKSAARSLGEQR